MMGVLPNHSLVEKQIGGILRFLFICLRENFCPRMLMDCIRLEEGEKHTKKGDEKAGMFGIWRAGNWCW